MSKIKNGGLDQYGAEPFEQQQFGTASVERVSKGVFFGVFQTGFHARLPPAQTLDCRLLPWVV